MATPRSFRLGGGASSIHAAKGHRLKRSAPASIDFVGAESSHLLPLAWHRASPRPVIAQRTIPSARFIGTHLCGDRRTRPTEEVRTLAEHPAIELAADAPNLEPLYRAACAVVAPLRQGAGTRTKVLEAMVRGTPMVLTPVATDGFDLSDRRKAFIEREPARLAACCGQLLDDPALATANGLAGRRTCEQFHRPEVGMGRIRAIIASALASQR
jgi:glycosyltransferase involved in cell wall biosynthesis